MSICNCCFEDYIVKCPDTLSVYAKTIPGNNYTWVIVDKFDREYSGDIISDGGGFFHIPVADLPEGLLTEFSGNFTFKLFEPDGCTPIKFVIASEYDCINFTVRAGTREKSNLGCQF